MEYLEEDEPNSVQ